MVPVLAQKIIHAISGDHARNYANSSLKTGINVFVKKTELEDADGNSAFEVTEFVFGEEKDLVQS